MAYTPPAGNAINFVFVNPGYVPPAGNAIHFVFGGSTPPPPPNTGLPTGLNRLRFDVEDAPGILNHEFAPIVSAPVVSVPTFRRPVVYRDEIDDWMPPRIRQFAVITVVVLQDSINISILW